MKIINSFIFFLVLSFSISTTILAQNAEIDSLKLVLQNHKVEDTIRVNLLNNLAFSLRKIDTTTAEVYLKKSTKILSVLNFPKGKAKNMLINGIINASKTKYEEGFPLYEESLKLNKSIGFDKGISECYKEMGHFYYKRGDQQQAISHYKKALAISEKLNDKEEIFGVLNDIGWSYILIGDYDEAESIYKEALLKGKGTKNKTLLSGCFSDLGIIYSYQGNYTIALDYYKKSLEIAQKHVDSVAIGNVFGNMGPIYTELENYDKAIDCFKESINYLKGNYKNATASNYNNIGLAYTAKKEYKRARQYLNDAKKVYREMNDKGGEAIALINTADVHLALNEYDTAYQYFESAKKMSLEVDNQRNICYSFLGQAKILVIKKKYSSALSHVLKGKKIADNLELLNFQRDANKILSDIYNHIGNYKKALQNHQQYQILNDSLFNKKNIEKITRLESEYKHRQALDSASIRELQLTKTITETNINLEKTQRNYLWAIIGVLLISMLLGAVIFYQKLGHAKAKTQNAVIEQKLLRSQMTPHFIFNSLSVLQGMILNKEEKKSINYLSKFSKLLRITLENSRDKTVSLSQELTAIKNYLTLQNLESSAYQSTVLVEDTIDVSLFEIPPMLIQPFVENAIEHAFEGQETNRKIDVKLTYADKKLMCFITDNGIGYKSQKANKKSHKKSLSSSITSERLKILSKDFKMEGSISIEDRQKYNEQGTIVTLVIPHKTLVV